jgi:hypothetical protein
LITFDPSSRLTNFLGIAYSAKGVALASLKNLSLIFPSATILQLSELKQNISAWTQRAGDPDIEFKEFAFVVVMFKKVNNKVSLLPTNRSKSFSLHPNTASKGRLNCEVECFESLLHTSS